MSYMIVYDRQVLVTPWGYSFIVLHGDNNVYEPRGYRGTERRVRNWNCWFLNKTPDEIREEFLEWCSIPFQEHFREHGLKGWDIPCGEHFRLSGRQQYVGDAELMRWVENGLKNARTIEDFVEAGHSISAHIAYWPADGSWSRRTAEAWIRSDAEFSEWVKVAEAAKKELLEQGVNHVFTILGFSQDEPLRLPRKTQKGFAGEAIVKYGRWYLTEAKGSGSFTISARFEDARAFSSYEEAKAATDGIRCSKGTRKILDYKSQEKAQSAKKYVIQFQWPSGRKEYVIQKIHNGWHHHPDINRAIRYDKNTAKKMLAKTERLNDKTVTASIVDVASFGR